jgi:hypothetical protein
MKKLVLLFCITISYTIYAQPYLDLVKIDYTYSPGKGINEKTNSLQSNYFNANINLPIELKKGGDAIILNPFFENKEGKVSSNDFHVLGEGALLGFLKRDIIMNWNLLTGFIVRQNTEAGQSLQDDWQYGGLILTTYKKSQSLSLKFGLYYNKEFFGNYFMPLVGIDWQINPKTNLFGVLPGSMTLDHKTSERFHYGFTFRALTNSYRLQTENACAEGDCTGKNYLRIDDNQLGTFGDVYLSKKIVLTGEAGYTILRRYRYGFKGQTVNDKTDYKNDNFYFRASLAYRIGLR